MSRYTELEWNLRFRAPAQAGDVYEFRVYADTTPVGTYTVTPQLTIGGSGISLAVDDATHGHTATDVNLTQTHFVIAASSVHGHTADLVNLSAFATVIPDNATHAHTADNVALVTGVLGAANATHAHSADNVVLVLGGITLAVDSTAHGSSSDSPTLTQDHHLVVDSAAHAHTADNVTTSGPSALAVDSAHHAHSAENVRLRGPDIFTPTGIERRRLRVAPESARTRGAPVHLPNGEYIAKRVAGDIGDTLLVIMDSDEPLDEATSFTGHVQRFNERHSLSATLVDAVERSVRVDLDSWLPDATPGIWGLEVVADFGAAVLTYASAREDGVRIDVRPDFG